jgi:dTDP-4-dehydrorhamnose 3,5-epimerase
MRLTETPLAGAFIVELEAHADERGFFARSYCRDEFLAHGVAARFDQCSISYNALRGTLRGLHWQADPHGEEKLVRCTAGAIFDVIVDLRPGSPTHRRWFGLELDAENRKALYIPKDFAHGFLSLRDASEVFYMISAVYEPAAARGLRWNDPMLGITWPLAPAVISARDAGFAFLDAAPAAPAADR